MSNQPPSPLLLAFAFCMLALTLLMECAEPKKPETSDWTTDKPTCVETLPENVLEPGWEGAVTTSGSDCAAAGEPRP